MPVYSGGLTVVTLGNVVFIFPVGLFIEKVPSSVISSDLVKQRNYNILFAYTYILKLIMC